MRISTLLISACVLLVSILSSGQSQFWPEPGRVFPIPVLKSLDGSVRSVVDQGDENFNDETTASTSSPWKPESLGVVKCQIKDGKYTYFKITFQASFNISYETTSEKGELNDLEAANSTFAYAAVNMPTINSCEAERNKSTDCTQINATFTWEADSASSKGNNWTLLLMYEVKNAPKSSLCDLDKQDKWDSFDYWLKGMKLEYYTIGNLFPHAVDPSYQEVENWGMHLFEVDSDSSYKCDSNRTFNITDSVSIYFKDFQSQAFQFEDSAFDTAKLCSEDDDGSSLVPIIVGCVLAGLIILTLIAYFIGRWHQNRQESYQAL